MKKNKFIRDVRIDKIGYQGIGLSTREDGKKIIVKGGVLPGSLVDCKVIREKKDYIECQIIDIKEMSTHFEPSKDLCEHYLFNKSLQDLDEQKAKIGCGGCKWQILPYEYQLELKNGIIVDSFRNIKDMVEKIGYPQIMSSPLVNGYRNKIEFSFGKYISAKLDPKYHINWGVGFHKQGEFSKIVDVQNCKLISDKANKIFGYVKNLLKNSGLEVYDAKTQKGFFRHLLIRQGFNTDQFLVVLSVNDNNLPIDDKPRFEQLKSEFKKNEYLNNNITSFVISYNTGLADTFRGQEIRTETLFGEGYIFEKLVYQNFEDAELNFKISPFSFFQTNTLGAQKLFDAGANMLGKTDGALLDLYCGSGSIGLTFLKLGLCDEVFGIEISRESIDDAYFNAKINGLLDKSYFVSGKAEEVIFKDENINQNLQKIKAIVVDPPREGMHKDMIKFLVEIKKQINFKLLYISCNPITMSRDIQLLTDGGFELKKLESMDMFPHTNHIEMLGILC